MATAKQPMVQIPRDVFLDLVRCHVLEEDMIAPATVRQVLSDKLDSLAAREYYTQMLRAPTPDEAEEARIKYLKLKT